MKSCTSCGAELPDIARFCTQCGRALAGGEIAPADAGPPEAPSAPRPAAPTAGSGANGRTRTYEADPGAPIESHVVKAVLVTLFCCLPLGIVALVHASRVPALALAGDLERAQTEANKADTWATGALLAGVVVGLVLVAFARSWL